MDRTGWIAVVALSGMLIGVDVTAGNCDPLPLQVLVVDQTGIPDTVVRQAQAEASRIFKAAGIVLTWLEAGEPPAGSLVIRITPTTIGQKAKNPNVLAVAPGSKDAPGRVASLFYHRIDDLARVLKLETSVLLGHVMAHEMGHLLLPHGAHAAAGLMMAGWDTRQAYLAACGALTFEGSQATLIRTRLAARLPIRNR